MNVLFDMSVLGASHADRSQRTGVARLAEELAFALAAAGRCEMSFCATVTPRLEPQCLEYLAANRRLSASPFFPSPLSGSPLYRELLAAHGRSVSPTPPARPSLARNVYGRALFRALRLLETSRCPLRSADLARADIFFSPFHPLPRCSGTRRRPRRFLNVCDVIALRYPQWLTPDRVRQQHRSLESLRPDDRVLTISHATKQDLCAARPDIDPRRVAVTHLAASPDLFYPCRDPARLAAVRARYAIPAGGRYVLCLNTLDPRKNLVHAIHAFATLLQQERIGDLCLVVAGGKGWKDQPIFEAARACEAAKGRIVFTGYVADEDLASLYGGAMAFVYPSLYEGFGLPPLEAMQCGVPVITSDASSLPEVVGDAGIMVPPTDMDALGAAMLSVYRDPALGRAMAERSLRRASEFSWPKTAAQTIAAFEAAS